MVEAKTTDISTLEVNNYVSYKIWVISYILPDVDYNYDKQIFVTI